MGRTARLVEEVRPGEAANLKPEDWKIYLDFVEECQDFIAEVERLRAEARPPAA